MIVLSNNEAYSAGYGLMSGESDLARAGMLDDKQVHLPSKYTLWSPPAMGESFTDSSFGTVITRLSNGLAQFNDAVHHEYSTMSPFNSDNSRILLLTENSGFYIADLKGNIIVPPDTPGLSEVGGPAHPRWSTSNPNVFYYHNSNRLRKFDLTTLKASTVRTFTQFNKIEWDGGEGDISEDGDHIMILGNNRYAGVYTFSTDNLGPTLDLNGLGGFDYFDITPNNNVIVRWNKLGTGRYRGFELYDKNMNFLRQVFDGGSHADRGRDMNGDEVLVILSATDDNAPPGCETNGVETIRLSDSQKKCIIGLNWDIGAHISVNSDGSNPWVLIEVTDENQGTVNSNGTLPANWQSRWKPYFNEIILVKIDGSEVRRLAQHRSRELDDYWFSPRAAISRDGSYAVFDSNFGTKPVSYYTDAFLVSLNKYPLANVSAASYTSDTLATASIASAFGTNLASTTIAATEIPLPFALGGTQVLITDSLGVDRFAPLFFVSPGQVNYQMPPGTANGPATISIVSSTQTVSSGNIQIESVMPGLFSANASGRGLAVGYVIRVKPGGVQTNEPIARFDTVQNNFVPIPVDLGPATDQVYLVLLGTGFRFRPSLSTVAVDVGGVNSQVTFAGAQGQFVGLDQINVLLPRTLIGRGLVDIHLSVGNSTGNNLQMNIK